jgi:hypothetical protein
VVSAAHPFRRSSERVGKVNDSHHAASSALAMEDAMTRPLVTVVMLALALSQVAPAVVYGQVIVVGNDEKVTFDDRGQPVFLDPGKDNVTFLDMSNRDMPVVIGTLPLPNSLIGPPTNVAVTPDQRRPHQQRVELGP